MSGLRPESESSSAFSEVEDTGPDKPSVVQTKYFCLGAWDSFKDLKVFPNYLYFNSSWLGKSG